MTLAFKWTWIFFIPLISSSAGTLQWPISPADEHHQVIASYGQFMGYPRYPFLHDGIDITADPGQPVISVQDGKVIAVRTDPFWGDLDRFFWHIVVALPGDTARSWVYAHVDKDSIRVRVGDTVQTGDTLAAVVKWEDDFDHIHFGLYNYSFDDSSFSTDAIKNPLNFLKSSGDTWPPVFFPAESTYFFWNYATGEKLNENILNGQVCISVGVRDLTFNPYWFIGIYSLHYWIKDFSGKYYTDTILSSRLDLPLGTYEESLERAPDIYDTIRSNSINLHYPIAYYLLGTWDTLSNRNPQRFLDTRGFSNGNYWLFVLASDFEGNRTRDSIAIEIHNQPLIIANRSFKEKAISNPFPLAFYDLFGRTIKNNRVNPSGIYILGNQRKLIIQNWNSLK